MRLIWLKTDTHHGSFLQLSHTFFRYISKLQITHGMVMAHLEAIEFTWRSAAALPISIGLYLFR